MMAAVMKRVNEEKAANMQERKWMSRFTIKTAADGEPKLFKGEQRVITQEEIFDTINEAHIRLLHAGRNILEKALHGIWRLSKLKHPPLQVGQNVRIPVPEFDRSKIDHRNIIWSKQSHFNGGYTVIKHLIAVGCWNGFIGRHSRACPLHLHH